MFDARQRWRELGMRHRVHAVFLSAATLLVLAVGVVIWVLAYGYLVNLRQNSGVRQAQASALTVDRLLSPQDPALPQQAQDLAGVNESAILVTRDDQVLAAVGLTPQQIPPRFRQRVEAGQRVRQRVRIDGEVRLLVGIPLRTGASYYQSLPFRNLNEALNRLRETLLIAAAVSLALSVLLARLAIRGALRPVQELTAAAHAVARGDLNTRLPENDRDLAEMARVFNTTTVDLQRRVRADARFAGTVSHELRNPLTTMANAVALLERRSDQLPPVAQEAVHLLKTQLARFRRLLLDLLDVAVDTDKPDSLVLEPVEVAGQVQSLAQAEGWGPVEVRRAPVMVRADPRRLDRIVSNLVRNAQTHGQGLVGVVVSHYDDIACIQVDDAGPGVPDSQRQHIFERFARGATDGSQEAVGIGLGLAFVAELAALHRGNVTVQDRPGGGARFTVELPLLTK